jgi:hypothetical protein
MVYQAVYAAESFSADKLLGIKGSVGLAELGMAFGWDLSGPMIERHCTKSFGSTKIIQYSICRRFSGMETCPFNKGKDLVRKNY